jgi:hypothetical protein
MSTPLPRTPVVDSYKGEAMAKVAVKLLFGVMISLMIGSIVALSIENKKRKLDLILLEDKVTQLEINLERIPTKRKFVYPH